MKSSTAIVIGGICGTLLTLSMGSVLITGQPTPEPTPEPTSSQTLIVGDHSMPDLNRDSYAVEVTEPEPIATAAPQPQPEPKRTENAAPTPTETVTPTPTETVTPTPTETEPPLFTPCEDGYLMAEDGSCVNPDFWSDFEPEPEPEPIATECKASTDD